MRIHDHVFHLPGTGRMVIPKYGLVIVLITLSHTLSEKKTNPRDVSEQRVCPNTFLGLNFFYEMEGVVTDSCLPPDYKQHHRSWRQAIKQCSHAVT